MLESSCPLGDYPQRKVLLLEGVSKNAVEHFSKSGFSVDYREGTLSRDELLDAIRDVHFVGIRSRTKIDRDVLTVAEKLQCIGCFCIGTDQVDLEAATERGIVVFNAPFANSRSVAELVIHNIIALARKTILKNIQMRNGLWNKKANGCFEVRGKTLGIIGYGNVGSQVSVLAEALGMRVQFFDILKKLPFGNAIACPDLQSLLSSSDFVTIHVPKTRQTVGLMGAAEFAMMRDGAFLINTSRGDVVNLEELADSCRLGGLALDVYPTEPTGIPNNSILKRLDILIDNVILTPHIGGSTEEAQDAIAHTVSEHYINYVFYGTTTGSVNIPEIGLEYHDGDARVCNIHLNQPGMMARLNQCLSEYNVRQQILITRGKIGYFICDLENVKDGIVLRKKIAEFNGSIRTRFRHH